MANRGLRLLVVLLCLGATSPTTSPTAAPVDPAAETLRRYYTDGAEPPWKAAVEALADPAPDMRAEAARWLTALVKRALADELSGAAPWRATVYWGDSGENPARELRREVALALAGATSLPAEATPLIVFLVREERTRRFQSAGARALAVLAGADARQLRLALVSEPHANGEVVAEALAQLARGREPVPEAITDALGRHHRAIVRDAARAIRRSPAFDPVAALASPPVARVVDEIGRLLVDAPAPNAPFVRVTTTRYDPQGKKERSPPFDDGWVQKRDGDRYTLLSPYGWTTDFTVRATPAADMPGGPPSTTTVEPRRIDDEVARIVALARTDRTQLSERGGLTGQFEDGPSTPELLIGWWCRRIGRTDLAAKLLLPAFDTVVADEDLVDVFKQRLGLIEGYKMLVAFVGERDYAEAVRVANVITTRFPKTGFHRAAVRLAAELPRRADDFRTFKLPTPAEWGQLQRTLPRPQQIAYLVARLRLLNAFQDMQPGGVDYFMHQTTEPRGMSPDASGSPYRGNTPLINPLVELMGERDGWSGAGRRTTGMALTVADIPQLAAAMRDDWFVLAVSYWRNFHPARHMHTTSELLSWVINDIAKQPLVDTDGWAALDAAARDKEIARISAWARARSGRTEADMLVAALEDNLNAGPEPPKWPSMTRPTSWARVSSHASRLVELKDARAVPLLLRFLQKKPSGDDLDEILALGRALRPEAFRDIASQHLADPNLNVRVQAALIRLDTGDKEGFRRTLAGVIAAANGTNIESDRLRAAVEALFADGAPESLAIARSLFASARDEKGHGNDQLLTDLARLYARHGLADPLRFYRRMLDRSGRQLGGSTYVSNTVAGAYADRITYELAPRDPAIIRITAAHPKKTDRLPALRKWLDARIADPASLPQSPR